MHYFKLDNSFRGCCV